MKYGDFILLMVLFIVFIIPLGAYLYKVITRERGKFDILINGLKAIDSSISKV